MASDVLRAEGGGLATLVGAVALDILGGGILEVVGEPVGRASAENVF